MREDRKQKPSDVICDWISFQKLEPGSYEERDNFHSLIKLSLGINGEGFAFAQSSIFYDWFSNTSVAKSVSSKLNFGLKNQVRCSKPEPEAKLHIFNEIEAGVKTATVDAEVQAFAGAICKVTGDISFANAEGNKLSVSSNSEITDIELGIGFLTFKPFRISDGTKAPLIETAREIKTVFELEPQFWVDSSIGLNVKSDGDIGEAKAIINFNFSGEIEITCKNCGGWHKARTSS